MAANIATTVIGAGIAGVGVFELLNASQAGLRSLRIDSRNENLSPLQRIGRLALNILMIAGLAALAAGFIVMGGTLVTAAPGTLFLSAFHQAINTSLPYFLGGFGAIAGRVVVGEVGRIINDRLGL